MTTEIYTMKFSINRCYIIKSGNNAVMIDGGPPNALKKFKKYLKHFNLEPEEIKLIVLTHGDFDHSGSAKDIKELTGARVAIHKNDQHLLEEGKFNWPRGVGRWGKFLRGMLIPFVKNSKLPPLNADIILSDNDYPLNEYGIPGKIVYTPGHTAGSVSVLLDSGEAFAGCLAHNNIPFRLKPNLPIFAEDLEQLKLSWKKIIKMGAQNIFPGHGDSFPLDKISNKI